MRKKSIIVSAFSSLFLVLIAFDSMTSGSGAAAGNTGAPNENTCATSPSCHFNAPVNKGNYINNLELFGDFTGGGYVPDSTYNITVRYKQNNKSKIGFETTVLDKDNVFAGALAAASRTRKVTTTINGKTRQYITHSSSGTSVSGDSIVWTFPWTAPSSNLGNVYFYVALNVTNNDGGTKGDSIYLKKFTIGTSSLLPQATASADTNVYCAGTSIQMKGSGTANPTAYSWTFPNGTPATSAKQNPTVTYNFKGTQLAILKVQNAISWSDPDTFRIQIKELPTAFIQGTFPTTICPGDSVKLQAAIRTGYRYNWSNGDTNNFTYAKKAGMYYVVTTSSEGCSRQSPSVQVKEFPSPSTVISSNALNDSACSGTVITFTGTLGADSIYLYKDFKHVSTAAGNQLSYKMDVTSDFNIRIKDTIGCVGPLSDTVNITVNKRLGAPVIECKDKTTTSLLFGWSDTTAGHTSGYQVSTDSGKTWKSPNTSGFEHSLSNLIPDKKYEIRVRAKENFPCFYSNVATKVCQTGPCNAIDVSVTHDTVVCLGSTAKVEVNGLTGHKFSLSLENGQDFNDSIFEFEPNISKTYLLELTDSANLGCPPEQIDLKINVDNIGQVVLSTSDQGNMYCEDDTIVFVATHGMDLYKFYVNGNLTATSQDSFHYQSAFKNLDTAFVVAHKGVCVDSSVKIDLIIIPLPDAGFTYSRDWKLYRFVPDMSFHTDYHWDFGDGDTSILSQPTHDYGNSEGQTVNVMLKVTDSEGCMNTESQAIDLPKFSDVREIYEAGIRVYPNPAYDLVYVEFTKGLQEGSKVNIMDLNGNVVGEITPSSNVTMINVAGYSSGVYLLQIIDGTSTVYGRIMIE